jgi:hypothetical protein
MAYKVYVPAKLTDEVAEALMYDPALDTVGLLRELRYYCNKRAEAGRPVPSGGFELMFDGRLRLWLNNANGTVRVLKAISA